MLYKFSPVYITPLTNPILCANIEKSMNLINYNQKNSANEYQKKFALYSIDCVRKLLLNHRVDNEWLFEQLDQAREAEIKNDQEFWDLSIQVLY